jgi:hypothetical protein
MKRNEQAKLLHPIWQKRLAAIFNRRPTRKWDADELRAFDGIVPIDEADLALIERYYDSERKKERSICRTTLLRLMRHWSGEVDRAADWNQRRNAKRRQFASKATSKGKPLSDAEFKAAGELAKAELERFRAALRNPSGR